MQLLDHIVHSEAVTFQGMNKHDFARDVTKVMFLMGFHPGRFICVR